MHWTGNKEIEGSHVWHVSNCLFFRDWFQKRVRQHSLFLIPFHTWQKKKKERDSDVNAEHISLTQKGQRSTMYCVYNTYMYLHLYLKMTDQL